VANKTIYFYIFIISMFIGTTALAGGDQSNFGIGLRSGVNRLEGDLTKPSFNPFIFGHLTYNAFDYLAIGFSGGYSVSGDEDAPDFQTIIMPYEGDLIFSFFPLGKVNPYVVLGAGGMYWNFTQDGETVRYASGKLAKGHELSVKSGGGLEIKLNRARTFYLNVGATFRYSMSDMLDNRYSGDENDGFIDVYGGFTYYFRGSARDDKDNDGVPDEIDLKSEIREDPDGYMDHDGSPDGIPPVTIALSSTDQINTDVDKEPPVVIHTPVRRAEEGQTVKIDADIYENKQLKVASVIYRPLGFDRWKVEKLRCVGGTLYQGIIPGTALKKQGLEYCVIAVDEAVSGVGYSGLPKLPIRVEVLGHSKAWRILSSAAALAGWGGASYLILRKQE